MTPISKKTSAVLALGGLLCSIHVASASFLALWDFGSEADGAGGLSGYTSSSGGGWSPTADAFRLKTTDPSNDFFNSSATTTFGLIGGALGADFELVTTVALTARGTSTSTFRRFGFVFLGAADVNGDVTDASSFYSAVFFPNQGSGAGQLRLQNGMGTSITQQSRASGSNADGTVYLMSLAGTYLAGGDLSLIFFVADLDGSGNLVAGSSQSMATTIANPHQGTHFGLGARLQRDDTLDYHTLQVIPEPSTYAMVLGGLVLVGAFVSRRRSRS